MNPAAHEPIPDTPRASLPLERALLFTFAAHGVGMLGMVLLQLPGMPGGPQPELALRAAYVATHPWLWRLGWLGWQFTALSDLLLAIALVATPWIRKTPALLTLACTLFAIGPDQYGQFRWTWYGVSLARSAVASGSYEQYGAFETHIFRLIAAYGTVGYLLAAIGWTWCFASAGVWSRRMTWLSVATWGVFALATAALFAQMLHPSRPLAVFVSVGNAVAFVLLMLWLAAVTERVLRRARPTTAFGHLAPWKYPEAGLFPLAFNYLANSRLVRAFFERLPASGMLSDITDVVYVNYLVPADRLAALLPPELELQRLGPDGAYAMFTHLTYKHGHFGMRCFPAALRRRCWPSPVQSNWRLYVTEPRSGLTGVYFLTTAITSTPHALAARLLSEGVPMHVPESAFVRWELNGSILLSIDPGRGTAPDLAAELTPMHLTILPGAWAECFGSWRDMLAYCVPQDRALASQRWYGRITRQEIELGIPLDACRPLRGKIYSRAAKAIVGDDAANEPLCFYVDHVAFRYLGEAVARSPAPAYSRQ
jgi:hypothetical protein